MNACTTINALDYLWVDGLTHFALAIGGKSVRKVKFLPQGVYTVISVVDDGETARLTLQSERGAFYLVPSYVAQA